jgi:hypothetical protein
MDQVAFAVGCAPGWAAGRGAATAAPDIGARTIAAKQEIVAMQVSVAKRATRVAR